MPKRKVLPARFYDRDFVKKILKENLVSFADPQHWRLREEEITHIDVDFLSFRPPIYDVMFTVLTGKEKKETMYFYENVLVKRKPARDERVYCRITSNGGKFYLIDGFSSPKFIRQLLEKFCADEKWDFMGFTGSFLGISGKAKVRVKSLKSLFEPKEEPTANYIYRCRGIVSSRKARKSFDVVIKKFLPRSPSGRGNREFRINKALPPKLVPKIHGALVNYSHRVGVDPQVLVLFSDFIKGDNLGTELWNLMLEIDEKKKSKKNYDAQLKKLLQTMKEVSEKVIFPFHKSLHDLWRGFNPSMRMPVSGTMRYSEESQKGIETLLKVGLLDEKTAREYQTVFEEAWRKILSELETTEIHADLMWSQIIRTERKNLVVLDLDEHMLAPPAKDLADLCAANRFLVESLPCRDRNFFRLVAEQMNEALMETYVGRAKEWKKQIKKSVPVYLALRHLHDAAYHLPIWMETTDLKVRERHEKYVNLSLKWFVKSMDVLKKQLRCRSRPNPPR
jgi:hypothetical protein